MSLYFTLRCVGVLQRRSPLKFGLQIYTIGVSSVSFLNFKGLFRNRIHTFLIRVIYIHFGLCAKVVHFGEKIIFDSIVQKGANLVLYFIVNAFLDIPCCHQYRKKKGFP